MATQFITTTIFNQLVAKLLKDNSSLTMQIGGLASDVNWAAAYPNKLQGNNLSIVAETSTSVRIKAGTIWTGSVARTLAADVVNGSLSSSLPNHFYAVDSGGVIVVTNVASFSPTPPVGTIKEIGVVYVSSAGKVFQITTIPSLVSQIASVTPTVTLVGWNKLTPAASGPFSAGNVTNAIQVVGQFNLTGVNKIGEFALTTGVSLPSAEVSSPSSIIAYSARDTQITVADALLNVTWNLVVNMPTTFY